MITDEQRLNWLAESCRKSPTGISFDWVPKCEGDPSGFRFMRRMYIGGPFKTIRDAIDNEMENDPRFRNSITIEPAGERPMRQESTSDLSFLD